VRFKVKFTKSQRFKGKERRDKETLKSEGDHVSLGLQINLHRNRMSEHADTPEEWEWAEKESGREREREKKKGKSKLIYRSTGSEVDQTKSIGLEANCEQTMRELVKMRCNQISLSAPTFRSRASNEEQ
jgi:hypothetical protein